MHSVKWFTNQNKSSVYYLKPISYVTECICILYLTQDNEIKINNNPGSTFQSCFNNTTACQQFETQ